LNNKDIDKYQDRGIGSDIDGDNQGRISLRNLRTFSSLKNPAFRFYLGGMLGQMAAMNMQMLARSLLIYRMTGSAAILGVMSLFHAIPTLSLSLFGGVIADRVQKKYVVLIGQAGSAVVSLFTALALTLGYLSAENAGSWWILAVAAVFQGIINALMMPSRQAILPEIVGEEQLLNAISLNMVGMNGLRLFAPAATGFLIDAFNFETVYYGMTGMYLMAVVFVAFVPLSGTISIRGGGAIADIKEGLQYLRHETTIVLIMALTLVVVVLSMPYFALMPIFTDDILNVGATGMGVLMSVSGIGAMTGSIILASLPNKKRGLMYLTACVVLSVALVGFSFSNSWPLSLVLITIVGFGATVRMTLSNNLIQYYVKDEFRGRVMSIYMMEFGLTSFGAFAAGVLAEKVGVQWAVGGFAIVLVFLSILALTFIPRVRRLD